MFYMYSLKSLFGERGSQNHLENIKIRGLAITGGFWLQSDTQGTPERSRLVLIDKGSINRHISYCLFATSENSYPGDDTLRSDSGRARSMPSFLKEGEGNCAGKVGKENRCDAP